MGGYKFFMRKAVQSSSGWDVGDEVDLESRFVGLRYRSCTGLRSYGKLKGVYTESFAERDGVSVYLSPLSVREQTDITLTLYFFAPGVYGAVDVVSRSSAIKAVGLVCDDFVSYVSGGAVVYRDTARQRKVLMYLSEKSEPSVDSVKGVLYMEVSFKFKNMFGRSFDVGDDTIERYLSGMEV